MKFDIQTVATKGMIVESPCGQDIGHLVEVYHNFDECMDSSYDVKWDGEELFTTIGAEEMSNLTVIANDERKFVWSQRGEGYCTYCLGGDDVEQAENFKAEGYRYIDADDACQCENCGIYSGEAAHVDVEIAEQLDVIRGELKETEVNGLLFADGEAGGKEVRLVSLFGKLTWVVDPNGDPGFDKQFADGDIMKELV